MRLKEHWSTHQCHAGGISSPFRYIDDSHHDSRFLLCPEILFKNMYSFSSCSFCTPIWVASESLYPRLLKRFPSLQIRWIFEQLAALNTCHFAMYHAFFVPEVFVDTLHRTWATSHTTCLNTIVHIMYYERRSTILQWYLAQVGICPLVVV